MGAAVKTPSGVGTVESVDLLKGRVKVTFEKDGETSVEVFDRKEVRSLSAQKKPREENREGRERTDDEQQPSDDRKDKE